MTMENENLSQDMPYQRPTSQETEHIIRVVGQDGTICDIAMTDVQLKDTLHFIRTAKDDVVKLSFNDAVLELLRIGIVRAVRYRK